MSPHQSSLRSRLLLLSLDTTSWQEEERGSDREHHVKRELGSAYAYEITSAVVGFRQHHVKRELGKKINCICI
jgi:hypothetical protein